MKRKECKKKEIRDFPFKRFPVAVARARVADTKCF